MDKMDIDTKSSDQMKAKFIEISAPFINQISDKLITNVNDILKTSNTTFKAKKFEEKFKNSMMDRWIDEFNTVWEQKNLHERLTVLNAKKKQIKQEGGAEKAWRAHGHTAEQQTQLCRNRVMAVHLLHMQELLEKQSSELQKLIFEVEGRRNFFNDVSKQREKVMADIDSKLVQLQDELNDSE